MITRFLLGLLLFSFAAFTVSARLIYVAPCGDDRNDGGRGTPIRSLSRVNRLARQGDMVIFEDGVYPGQLAPLYSGTSARPIYFRAANPGGAVLSGGRGGYAILLQNCSYLVIDGFDVVVPEGGRYLGIFQSSRCRFYGLSFSGGRREGAIMCDESGYNRFTAIEIQRSAAEAKAVPGGGNFWINNRSFCNIFEDVRIRRGGPRALFFGPGCRDNVVRDSYFDDCDQGGIDGVNQGRILLERNVFGPAAGIGDGLLGNSEALIRRSLWSRGSRWSNLAGGKAVLFGNSLVGVQTSAGKLPGINTALLPEKGGRVRNGLDGDFRLLPKSPEVDSGVFPTRVMRENPGSGAVVSVENPGFFYDGFGIPGEKGDVLWIGAARTPVRVMRISGNDLLLDRKITVEKGANVSPPFHGKAPDRGAYELGVSNLGPDLRSELRANPSAKKLPSQPLQNYPHHRFPPRFPE